MFGAVVCPRCRKGFAVDLEHRSCTCPHCGHLMQARRLKPRFTSTSASLTARAVGELNARGRELKGFKGKLEKDRKASAIKASTLEELARELAEFDLVGLEKALNGRMEAEEALRRLMSSSIVYESAPGRYRVA